MLSFAVTANTIPLLHMMSNFTNFEFRLFLSILPIVDAVDFEEILRFDLVLFLIHLIQNIWEKH